MCSDQWFFNLPNFQIARALVIFNIDEVIIFDESNKSLDKDAEFQGVGRKGNANVQLARILQYLECPQYLRKSFFPKHVDLQYAGKAYISFYVHTDKTLANKNMFNNY